MSGVTAYDIEDGDLTGSVEMSTDFTSEQPGVYDVRYSVTDSDGNTTVETRTVAVTNAAVYASDVSRPPSAGARSERTKRFPETPCA